MFVVYDKENQKVPIKIWRHNLSDIEEGCLEQAYNLSNHPCVAYPVALMPDTHMGYGMPIGGVLALDGAVCPNAVGVDIGCGMVFLRTNVKISDIDNKNEFLLNVINSIKQNIPMGFSHNTPQKKQDYFEISKNLVEKHYTENHIELQEQVASQIGTLGGGNHFIEIQKDENDYICLMIHSGSRNVGLQIGKKYNNLAKALNKQWHSNIDSSWDLAFLPIDTTEGLNYIKEMNFALEFAKLNRMIMMEIAFKILANECEKQGLNVRVQEEINIHHNYASVEKHKGKYVTVHRKGATAAFKNQLGIIPGSMGTSSFIVKGLGNEESLCSCSHGAGRKMGRKKAKQEYSVEEFQDAMKDVVSLDINEKTLDESPMAYKNINEVIELQSDLVEVVSTLTPLANCKG